MLGKAKQKKNMHMRGSFEVRRVEVVMSVSML